MFDASDWELRLGVTVVLSDEVCGWVFGCLGVCSARAERKKVQVCEKPIAVEWKSRRAQDCAVCCREGFIEGRSGADSTGEGNT